MALHLPPLKTRERPRPVYMDLNAFCRGLSPYLVLLFDSLKPSKFRDPFVARIAFKNEQTPSLPAHRLP
jgi:hypothetical protein